MGAEPGGGSLPGGQWMSTEAMRAQLPRQEAKLGICHYQFSPLLS